MGTIMLVGMGIFIGWLIFRPKNDNGGALRQNMPVSNIRDIQAKGRNVQAGKSLPQARRPMTAERSQNNHTLRNVAGGMVAGAVLGHMLSGDHKAEAHATTNNYNTYNEYYDHDDYDDYDGFDSDSYGNDEDDEDYMDTYDYDSDDDYDTYDTYDSSDYDDDSYDSGSDWDSDSYDDGGEW
ncbi:hypothetical protein SELR_22610 [Selenomonas ruminantium subsp. lactilytica TAM6421]|uniref:Uncharacterized protein n=1 Tax=Selenomonas ruminantium subsp. lactilytica (strain NBRC 103574 / TAM6421) TaxID=927704 RepID=I0GT82_SELRL|nr:hypothetical protein [Selenomonas ruminantium]BAL83969.1 hypothetical protein SELR_22610 [Selenomonas ruminantium subsp. lactilytica TAM6421]